jgi:hypothetical protein
MELLSRMGIHKAILAPELVSRGAVLRVAVCYDVSAEAAMDDEDFPQLVVREVLPVTLNVSIASFQYHVTAFTVIDRVKNCLVTFVHPALRQIVRNRLRINQSLVYA